MDDRVLRKVIRDTELIKMERMAAAISDNRYRDLWKEIEKIKGRNTLCSNNVDGKSVVRKT